MDLQAAIKLVNGLAGGLPVTEGLITNGVVMLIRAAKDKWTVLPDRLLYEVSFLASAGVVLILRALVGDPSDPMLSTTLATWASSVLGKKGYDRVAEGMSKKKP